MEEPNNASHSTEFTASPQEQSDLCLYIQADEQPSTVGTADHPHPFLDHDETSSTHGDTHALAQDCGYNSSASSTERSSSESLGGDLDYEELRGVSSRTSSRSSISSIPTSALDNSIDGIKLAVVRRSHQDMLSHPWDDQNNNAHGVMEDPMGFLPTVRKQHAAFRKTSSVRAMQMHTEDEGDGEYLTPPKRRGAHRMSDGSSPIKRSPYYSPTGIVAKHKIKREYPLVLLHCNLLPPSLPIPRLANYPDQKILREVLPPEYWSRWKLLEEKIGSVVLRERGVLISHPEDMYDLLEERLLESLELQRPRFDHGHFLGHENDTDRDDQAMIEESGTDDEQGEQCPDCGGHVVRYNDAGRKWEIRVFAANGLMRAGAWAAAWKEMEKVDVEVGLWLPSEVRRELEKRLLEGEMSHAGNRSPVPQMQEPVNGIASKAHNDPSHLQCLTFTNDAPKLLTIQKAERPSLPPAQKRTIPHEYLKPDRPNYPQIPVAEIELQTLLVNYIRVLASDRRNVAIAFLSVLVFFFAVNTRSTATISHLEPFPSDMLETVPRPTMSLTQSSSVVREKPTGSMKESLETSEVRVATVSPAHQYPSPVPSQSITFHNTNLEYSEVSEVDLAKPGIPRHEPPPEKKATEVVAEQGSTSTWPIKPTFHSAMLEPRPYPIEWTEEVDPVVEISKNGGGEESTAVLVI